MKRLCIFAIIFALFATPFGCKRNAEKKKGTIGVSVLTMTNPFFKVIGDTITEEAAKHGYDTIVVSGEEDVDKQQKQVKDFIVKGVSAIVLCPCDPTGIGPVIQEANAANIPVFTADLACIAPDAKVVSHIATDNLDGGRLAAKGMIEALGPAGGKIAVLHYERAESCLLRVKGFKEVIEQHNKDPKSSNIDIVAVLPGEGDKEKGYKAAQAALETTPDLAGIFAINDPSALGARAALEKAGKAEQVKIIGFDGQPAGKRAIKEGKIYADPIQFPDEIGRTTVQFIMRHFDGEVVPRQKLIPTKLYKREDALRDPSLE